MLVKDLIERLQQCDPYASVKQYFPLSLKIDIAPDRVDTNANFNFEVKRLIQDYAENKDDRNIEHVLSDIRGSVKIVIGGYVERLNTKLKESYTSQKPCHIEEVENYYNEVFLHNDGDYDFYERV